MTTAGSLPRGEIIQQLDGTYELFPVPTGKDTLFSILKDCLDEWERIRIGMLLQGAVWEIKPPREPRIGFLDGCVTVDFEEWRLHLCIGEQKSAPPEVARLRRAVPPAESGPAACFLGLPPLQRRGATADNGAAAQPALGRKPELRGASKLGTALPVRPVAAEIPVPRLRAHGPQPGNRT